MRKLLRAFLANDSGATAIEYAMIAGLVSIVIVGAVTQIGTTLSGFFQSLAAHV
jgi:pilus assembly protein Flp/PilA